MTEKIINKTPHPVYILDEDNSVLKVFPKSVGMIRVPEQVIKNGEIAGIPISTTLFHEVEGAPEYQEGVYYIVSQLVRSMMPDREDFLVPKDIVRDKDGTIIGCRYLDKTLM